MGTSIQKVTTRGVQDLDLAPFVLEALFRKAEELTPTLKLISFAPQGNLIVISDGAGHKVGTLQLSLPEKLWIIVDDYGDRLVATLLLSREY